ncbi:hypothetical protein TNCV_1042361 [Trichonephila clavipes]|nr:hypothetical protein TNCV_1042361 [Trichonephila clavipes]
MRKAVLTSQISLKRAVVLSNAYQPFFKNSIENEISKRKNGELYQLRLLNIRDAALFVPSLICCPPLCVSAALDRKLH